MEIQDQLNKLLNEIKEYQNLNTNFSGMINTLKYVSNSNDNEHQKIKDTLGKMSMSANNLQAKYSDYLVKLNTATSEIKEVSNLKLKELELFTQEYKTDVGNLKSDFSEATNNIKHKADESINSIKSAGISLYNNNQKILKENEEKLNEIAEQYTTNVNNQINSLNDTIDKFKTDCTYIKSDVKSNFESLKKNNEKVLNGHFYNQTGNINRLFEDLKEQNIQFLDNKLKELKENEINKLIKNQLLFFIAILVICLVTMGFTIYSILN